MTRCQLWTRGRGLPFPHTLASQPLADTTGPGPQEPAKQTNPLQGPRSKDGSEETEHTPWKTELPEATDTT